MNSLGEVGKKMRSAIKAKLLELGTGSQTGYIDDELPDYVMIMVANKRDKDQMKKDLQLFLGSNTESFVNWLHQVLQKLQEVTLPNNLVSKAKKKIAETATKKDKKKDGKKKKEPSITDVIAVELMEKAKTLEEPKLKDENSSTPKKHHKTPEPEPKTPPSRSSKEDDEFNIPTISEMKTAGNMHKKELSQLAEIQSRIYEAKKKLRDLDSDDEKMLQENKLSKTQEAVKTKPSTVISLSAIKKAEKEIYIAPSFRKLIEKQKEENDRKIRASENVSRREVSRREHVDRRSRSRSRDRFKNRREKGRERSRSPRRPSIRDRIGSRFVKSPPRKTEAPKPPPTRPSVRNARTTVNAGKNLLLRAVAEAQKSTKNSVLDSKIKKSNIVVQVAGRHDRDSRRIRMDEEYVPESKSIHLQHSDAEYRPSRNLVGMHDDGDDGDVIYLSNMDEVDLDDLDRDENMKSPQFVVTMDGAKLYDHDSHSPTPPPVIKRKNIKDRIGIRPGFEDREPSRLLVKRKQQPVVEEEHESLKAYNRAKRSRVSPIKFDLTDEEDNKSQGSPRKRDKNDSYNSNGDDKKDESMNSEDQKKIKLEPSRSFDHVPSLLAVVSPDPPKQPKTKERCKYYPSCTNTNCAFYHPTLPCKMFPACKYGDTCAYVHPRCKFDLSCTRTDCNFSHTQVAGPPISSISSSVVSSQSFKPLAPAAVGICKFFPNCSNTNCTFTHPRLCKFGKGCLNKFECNYYHIESAPSSKSKFKWTPK